jgi:hypothetical protein
MVTLLEVFIVEWKRCTACGVVKELSCFHRNICKKDGYHFQCKECRKIERQKYRAKTRQREAAYQRQYYAKNKEPYREYYRKNKEKLLRAQVDYARNRRMNDPVFKITENLRRRVRKVLVGDSKSASIMHLIGCSANELRCHIEKQFAVGMTWENYGDWHLDHVMPCASYNLADKEQQKECFNYKNLQPLWAVDNLRKGATISKHSCRPM